MRDGGRTFGDRIEIRDLGVMGRHGLLAEEKARTQPFSIDLDVTLATRRASETDELAETVDYGALLEQVAGIVRDRHFELLEALAAAIAEDVLGDEHVAAVKVTVRKVRPPVEEQVGSIGVTVHRRREERGE